MIKPLEAHYYIHTKLIHLNFDDRLYQLRIDEKGDLHQVAKTMKMVY